MFSIKYFVLDYTIPQDGNINQNDMMCTYILHDRCQLEKNVSVCGDCGSTHIVVHVGDGPCVGTMALHFTGTLFSSFKKVLWNSLEVLLVKVD